MGFKSGMKKALSAIPGALLVARLVAGTVRVCLRYRVTGLAAEAGFFLLLSLPPMVLGLFAGVGYIGQWLGPEIVQNVSDTIEMWASTFLTDAAVRDVIVPTVSDVLGTGRADLLSIGFLLSLWSGSRALNVFIDTISIMYGQSGVRGIVGTRALSLSLYLLSVLIGAIVIPLVIIGPSLLSDLLPDQLQLLIALYWPVVGGLGLASLTSLYHIATPRRSPWPRDIPGAVLTVVIWVVTSYFVRMWAGGAVGGTSVYGPLSAPIIVLIYMYFLAIAVLIGAAFNAACRKIWPPPEYQSPRERAMEWLDERRDRESRPLTPVPEQAQEDLRGTG